MKEIKGGEVPTFQSQQTEGEGLQGRKAFTNEVGRRVNYLIFLIFYSAMSTSQKKYISCQFCALMDSNE